LERPEPRKDLVCHTASNPFKVRLLGQGTEVQQVPNPVPNPGVNRKPRKRVKSPLKKASKKRESSSSQTEEIGSPLKSSLQNSKLKVKLGKANMVRCTPEGKRRKPLNLEPDG
jgi:condensin-2 complex subunit H2